MGGEDIWVGMYPIFINYRILFTYTVPLGCNINNTDRSIVVSQLNIYVR